MRLQRGGPRRVPAIVQLTQTECGLCACLMLLRAYGSQEPLSALRRDYEVGRDGLSLRELRDLLRSRGMESGMYRVSPRRLRSVQLPVIAYWEHHHYVVLERLDDRGAVIVDPASGRRRVSVADFERCFSERIVTGRPGADFVAVRHRERNPWLAYLTPARAAWPRVTATALLSLLVFGAGLVAPALTRWLIDSQARGEATGWSGTALAAITGFALTLLGLSAARAFIITSVTVHVGRASMHRVFGHLLRLPYRYFSLRSPGELMFRLNSVNVVRDMVSVHLAQGALDLGMSVALAAYMLTLSPLLTALSCGFYLLILAVLVVTRRRVRELLDAELNHASKSQSMQLESVVAAAALRISGDEERFLDDWAAVFERSLVANRRRSNLQGLVNSAVGMLQLVAPLTVFLVGLSLVQERVLTLGTVVAFQAVAAMFFSLASAIFGCWSQLVQGRSYLSRLADITGQELPVRGRSRPGGTLGRVELRDVSFRYSRNAPDAVAGIDMVIRPGERIAIVGASGSGKSTLGKLLCGLFEPTSGTVEFDGLDLLECDRGDFYRRVGYVPQEVHLLNRSILENITMGRADLGEDDARAAAGAAQIGSEILALPMQYQTLVSEMGANFSGGQRQRIALARALVKRPEVLILDEATSSLDSENESRITATLRGRSCTLVVIAHRLSTVMDADRIYVMEAGRIVQCGTHSQLAAVDGAYRSLFDVHLQEPVSR